MILIDTSSWIEMLRASGKVPVRQRVNAFLESGDARICQPVLLELWSGARGAAEKKSLREIEAVVPGLPISDEVWDISYDLAQKARQKGLNVPHVDLLIAACAIHHKAGLETCDRHFEGIFGL